MTARTVIAAAVSAGLLASCLGEVGPAPPAPVDVPADAESAVIDRVVDGDTVRVLLPPGSTSGDAGSIRVRLLNIDAPELARDGQQQECLARDATERLEGLLEPGDLVWLAADREGVDDFGRLLRGLWTDDGTFVNEFLAAEGLAEPVLFPPNDRFHASVVAAADRAEAQGRGLHGAGCR